MKSSKSNTLAETHWGELPPRETHRQEIITPDVIENIWRQITDETKQSVSDLLLQSSEHQEEKIQLNAGDPHVHATINLHQQLRALNDGTSWRTTFDTVNSSPTRISENPFDIAFPCPDSRNEQERSTMSAIDSSHEIDLRPETARQILRHAVIVLLAHVGFETSVDTAVETLTDVTEQFLIRTTRLIKLAMERDEQGFPDAVERVLLETGIGGVQELHDYYQENVLRFEEHTRKKVEKLAQERRHQIEVGTSSIKMEHDDGISRGSSHLDEFGNVYGEVPTLQLLDPDLGFPPSLDAGFQMLHSLEQEGLNGLEVEEEEVNVSDSPDAAQSHRNEQLMVSDKRKRT